MQTYEYNVAFIIKATLMHSVSVKECTDFNIVVLNKL